MRKTRYKVPLLTIYVIAWMGLMGCDNGEPAPSASQDPLFEWFSYEGNDPVYDEFEASEDEFYNPILSGFYPDPSIVRDGEDYYTVHSSFSWYPGIPIFHSRDLVNWTQVGYVLDRPSQLDVEGLNMSEGVFAPTINYHDGTFYVLSTLVGAGGNFLVTTDDPAGDWSDPVMLPDVQGIDPSIFFDDDGTIYILNNGPPDYEPLYDGHRALWIQEYDPETETTGPDEVIVDGGVDIEEEPIWIEAPHLMKIDGEYILSAAEGGTGPQHSQVVFRGDSPRGPFEPYEENPILTQRHLDLDRPYPVNYTGHADMVETQNGEWWAVFLGVRPYKDDYFNTGRETFLLPVEWTDDGWPVILEGDETVPFVHSRPDLPEQPEPEIPMSGNFSYTDNFDDAELAHNWNFIRTPPDEAFHQLNDEGLRIEARSERLGDFTNPSFIGRRQQHDYASVSTSMIYDPAESGDTAGLVAFQNDEFYYFMGVTLDDDGNPVIQLEKRAGDDAEVVATESLTNEPGEAVYMKIEAEAENYHFYYGYEQDDWLTLEENADGTILSTAVADGFVGAMFGMYAYTE